MKTILISIIGTALLALWTLPVQAQTVTEEDAFTVAQNWVTLILKTEGKWGDSETAGVLDIQEFKRGDRVIGYFCRVWPKGYIITSLRKELAPVKVYSDTGDLDPLLEEGMADLIKGEMEQILLEVDKLMGPIPVPPDEQGQSFLEFDYRASWENLGKDITAFEKEISESVIPPNYAGGNPWLLSSEWDQGYPYNIKCPNKPSGSSCGDAQCPVGCGPVAAAQTMRYWAWPPGYDWVNMPNSIGSSSADVNKNAVAILCHDVGVQADADYCAGKLSSCETSTYFAGYPLGADLLDTFEDGFWYSSSADSTDRNSFGAVAWFDRIKDELNQNRPLPYRVKEHVIVCDGWKERWEGSNYIREYHMNYGWADSSTAWWTLDGLNLGGVDEERIIVNLKPGPSMGSWLSGSPDDAHVLYGVPSSTYRYFDQDAMGRNVTFAAGHNLQFLQGVSVRGTSPVGDSIRFSGTPSATTRMFSIKGTAKGGSDAGIRLENGGIRLYNTGSIQFH
jgi:hypothetical protein